MRSFRTGPQTVIQKLLGIPGIYPTGVRPEIYPTAEMRALRPWEEFDEQIVRWYVARFEAAVAAEFSYVSLGPASLGYLMVIDFVRNHSAITVDVRLGMTLNPVITVVPGAPGDFRIGPPTAPPLNANCGAEAAPDGTVIARMQAATEREFHHILAPNEGAGSSALNSFAIVGGTANTAVSVDIMGRLVPLGGAASS